MSFGGNFCSKSTAFFYEVNDRHEDKQDLISSTDRRQIYGPAFSPPISAYNNNRQMSACELMDGVRKLPLSIGMRV
jgi:hypothetical protein